MTAVDLSGDLLLAAKYAVGEMVALRCIGGRPIPKAVLNLHQLLKASSAGGTESSPDSEESVSDDLIGSAEAAEELGCTDRYIREIASELDGRKCGTKWVFRRRTVVEYREAKGGSGGGD